MPYPRRPVTGHIVRGEEKRSINSLILRNLLTEPGLALALPLSSPEF